MFYHIEITTVGGDKFIYSNCTYYSSKYGIEIHTSEKTVVTFVGNYTAKIISIDDFKKSK